MEYLLMLGDDLRFALGMAVERARKDRHEFLTLEHLLYALLHEPRAAEIIEACGGDMAAVEKGVEEVLGDFESLPGDGEYDPVQTVGFRRVLQRAEILQKRLAIALCPYGLCRYRNGSRQRARYLRCPVSW